MRNGLLMTAVGEVALVTHDREAKRMAVARQHFSSQLFYRYCCRALEYVFFYYLPASQCLRDSFAARLCRREPSVAKHRSKAQGLVGYPSRLLDSAVEEVARSGDQPFLLGYGVERKL